VRTDDGSATLWVLLAALVLGLLGAVSVLTGVAMTARHRAAAAADAAALAAALAGPVPTATACHAARRAATLNGAALRRCEAAPGPDAPVAFTVRVELRPPRALAWLGPAVGRSRAGAIPAQGQICVQAGRGRNLASSPSLCSVTTPLW
jgi:secretion/DNA translocation related TadE-like protein